MIYQLLILINHSKLETAISIIYVYNMCVFHHCWLYIYMYIQHISHCIFPLWHWVAHFTFLTFLAIFH